MCGIAGIIGEKYQIEKKIKFLNKSIFHRGPDDNGFYIDKSLNIGLTSTRLSIIGIEEGKQPKISDDKKIVIFFNGEIFNYKELIKKYLDKDNQIKSDTEVILKLYLKFGISFLDKLNGMFAISIYDKRKNILYLIKDRFGIKPLYFYNLKKKIIFSSEINSITNLISRKSLNTQAVSNFLTMGFINSPNTIYKEIQKVEPATYLKINLSNLKIIKKKWWIIDVKKISKINSDKKLIKIIEQQIIKSVKLWSVSDVPISFLLSGGLDSGLITAIYKKLIGKKTSTYSYIFNFNKMYERWNESKTINDFLKKYRTNHKNYYFNKKKFINEFHNIIKHLGEPFGGGLPSWYLLKDVSRKHKVTLTGVGGDELFGNYNRPFKILNQNEDCYKYRNFKKYYFYNKFYLADHKFKKKYTNLNLSKLDDPCLKYFKKFKQRKEKFSKINNLSLIDFDLGLSDDYLYYNDRFSMAHSVELRTPYLDHELVQLIFSIPSGKRINNTIYKPLLRKISKKYLPLSYFNQEKKGFSIPLSEIMRKNYRNKVLYYLSKKNLKKVGIMKTNFYDNFVIPLLEGDNTNISLVWHVLIFQIWYMKFFRKNENS